MTDDGDALEDLDYPYGMVTASGLTALAVELGADPGLAFLGIAIAAAIIAVRERRSS